MLWIFWSLSWSLSADAVCPVESVSDVNGEPWKSTPRKTNNIQTGTYKECLAQMQLFSKLCELILLLQTNLVNQQLPACSLWEFFSIFSLYGLRWWQKWVIDSRKNWKKQEETLWLTSTSMLLTGYHAIGWRINLDVTLHVLTRPQLKEVATQKWQQLEARFLLFIKEG